MGVGIALVSGAVNVALDFAWIPGYGIRGAALATVVAYAVSAALTVVYVQRRLQQNVVRLGVFVLPVVIVCACLAFLDAARFYVIAIPAGAVAVSWLVHYFQLFRGEDATFLKDLRYLAAAASGTAAR